MSVELRVTKEWDSRYKLEGSGSDCMEEGAWSQLVGRRGPLCLAGATVAEASWS